MITPLKGASSVIGQGQGLIDTRSMLQNPTKLADLIGNAVKSSLAAEIFPNDFLAPSGYGLYTQLTPDDLKVEGIGGRTEHTEYPMVRISPSDLKEARTSDIGGKFRVSDEALEAGDSSLISDGISLIIAGLRDTLDEMTIAALEQITEPGGPGHHVTSTAGWRGVTLVGANPTPENLRPWADIVHARRILRDGGLNASPTHLIVDPETADELSIIYGPELVDDKWGLTISSSNKVAAGTGYLLDNRLFGGMVTKKGLIVETWREPAIRATWVQVYIEPSVFVSRTVNVARIVGLDGSVANYTP